MIGVTDDIVQYFIFASNHNKTKYKLVQFIIIANKLLQTLSNILLHFPLMAQNTHNENNTLSNSKVQNGSNGLKEYLEVSSECQFVRKRIKVLTHIQSHNQAKVRLNQQSLDRIQNSRVVKSENFQHKQQLLKRKKLIEQEQKQNNIKRRHDIKSKINEVMKEIQEQRIQDRNKIRQQSQNIAQKIHQNKQKDLNQKREKRNRVLQIQNQSKQNYKMFFVQKKNHIAKINQQQTNWWGEKKKEKNQQIKRMNKIEVQILGKQSETIKQFDTVRGKLRQIYGIESRPSKTNYSLHCNPRKQTVPQQSRNSNV